MQAMEKENLRWYMEECDERWGYFGLAILKTPYYVLEGGKCCKEVFSGQFCNMLDMFKKFQPADVLAADLACLLDKWKGRRF